MTGAAQPSVGVRRVTNGEAELLARFLQQTWDPAATADTVRAYRAEAAEKNPHGVGIEVPTFLFVKDGEAIGHVATIPMFLQLEGRSVPAHWLKGLMILPEARNGPVGFLLVKEAVKTLDVSMALVVKQEARRLFTALGYRDVGALVDYVRLLDGRAVMSVRAADLGYSGRVAATLTRMQRLGVAGIGGSVLQVAVGLVAAVAGSGSRKVQVKPVGELDPNALEALWQRCRPRLRAGTVRDSSYLLSRYSDPLYKAAMITDSIGPAALAIVRDPASGGDSRLAGVRLATISDLLAATNGAALGVIAAAEGIARRAGAHALVCGASHPALRTWLLRRAFAPVGGRAHLLVRAPADMSVPAALDDWWITRGDSNADEGF